MKSTREAWITSEGRSRNTPAVSEDAEFHARRMNQKNKIKAKRDVANKPVGNDEYEQSIAEDVNFNTDRLIAEEAFFTASRRDFEAGNTMSAWLQAEADAEGSSIGLAAERRNGAASDRRNAARKDRRIGAR